MLASLGALGVVYGDIGTSPLYAMRECLSPSTEHVTVAQPVVMGGAGTVMPFGSTTAACAFAPVRTTTKTNK